jgi:hypothetical protein
MRRRNKKNTPRMLPSCMCLTLLSLCILQ